MNDVFCRGSRQKNKAALAGYHLTAYTGTIQ